MKGKSDRKWSKDVLKLKKIKIVSKLQMTKKAINRGLESDKEIDFEGTSDKEIKWSLQIRDKKSISDVQQTKSSNEVWK